MFQKNDLSRTRNRNRGFTLLEVIVSLGVMVIIFGITLTTLVGRRSGVRLDTTVRQIVSLLREAQSRSAAQEGSTVWGVHFYNSTSSAFYALFKTSYSATNTMGSYLLPSGIRFASSSIPSGNTFDVTFAQISGIPSSQFSLKIESVSGGTIGTVVSSSIVNITQTGEVSY